MPLPFKSRKQDVATPERGSPRAILGTPTYTEEPAPVDIGNGELTLDHLLPSTPAVVLDPPSDQKITRPASAHASTPRATSSSRESLSKNADIATPVPVPPSPATTLRGTETSPATPLARTNSSQSTPQQVSTAPDTPQPSGTTLPLHSLRQRQGTMASVSSSLSRKSRSTSVASGGIASALALSGAALAHSAGAGLHQKTLDSTSSVPASALTASTSGTSHNSSEEPSRAPSIDSDHSSLHPAALYHQQDLRSLASFAAFDDDLVGLGTGYAVASSKRQADFHALFRNDIPDDDYLIDDMSCALQRDILAQGRGFLVQGRLYVSENHLCFYANFLGWITSLVIPFSDVITIEKRMTAFVIPNAILVTTMHNRHNFASFLSRDNTYDLITSIWRTSHPVVPAAAALPDSIEPTVENSSEEDELYNHTDDTNQRSRKRDKVIKIRRRLTRDTDALQQQQNLGPPVPVSAARRTGSYSTSLTETPSDLNPVVHHPTTCACKCSPSTEHYPNVAMDAVFPSTPEKIYNLLFMSAAFMREFWANSQQLTQIEVSDWAPSSSSSGNSLSRSVSYIKPLNAAVGPKSAKCVINDEALHADFDNYTTTLTTTRTPEVPVGGSFCVKTKTCIMWRPGNTCRVLVTTQVEWLKSSFLKGVITSSSIDGQKAYHKDLEQELRKYIAAHPSEFSSGRHGSQDIEGQEADGVTVRRETEEEKSMRKNEDSEHLVEAKEKTNATNSSSSALLSSLDKVSSGLSIISTTAIDIITATLDTIKSLVGEAATSHLILTVVVIVLVLSNLWTLFTLHSGQNGVMKTGQRVPPPMYIGVPPQFAESVWYGNAVDVKPGSEQAQHHPHAGLPRPLQTVDVASALKSVLIEYFSDTELHRHRNPNTHDTPPAAAAAAAESPQNYNNLQNVEEMEKALEALEKKIDSLRQALRVVEDKPDV